MHIFAKRIVLYFSIICCFSSSVVWADSSDVPLEKFTLSAGESKKLSLDTDMPTVVGWRTKLEMNKAKECKNNCIKMTEKTDGKDRSMSSMFGGSFEMKPSSNKIVAEFLNVESFPIEIEVYKKQG